MNSSVTIDWKFVVALGAATAGVILVVRMDRAATERVSIRAIDTIKELATAGNSDR